MSLETEPVDSDKVWLLAKMPNANEQDIAQFCDGVEIWMDCGLCEQAARDKSFEEL